MENERKQWRQAARENEKKRPTLAANVGGEATSSSDDSPQPRPPRKPRRREKAPRTSQSGPPSPSRMSTPPTTTAFPGGRGSEGGTKSKNRIRVQSGQRHVLGQSEQNFNEQNEAASVSPVNDL
ncbi:hypothetical protein HPB50_003783 [Hyalomma asiaticum]|uniref:Uncharacterized protein n=1 Tax=Hyalomma asiaticum TaxID=266040 RepID=A0ACB7S3A7_HYAAI|nr:hypothetical protein HPB50_003783 [Hyalomma asiaticum]